VVLARAESVRIVDRKGFHGRTAVAFVRLKEEYPQFEFFLSYRARTDFRKVKIENFLKIMFLQIPQTSVNVEIELAQGYEPRPEFQFQAEDALKGIKEILFTDFSGSDRSPFVASSSIFSGGGQVDLLRSPGGVMNINYQIEQFAALIENEVRKSGVEQAFIAFVKQLEADRQPQTLNNFSEALDQADGVGQYLSGKLAELAMLYIGQNLSESDITAGIQTDFKFVLSKVVQQLTASAALVHGNNVGGINFDPTLLNLQIKRDGKGVPLPLPQQNLENININGFYPVIINIQPVNAQTLPLLGQLETAPDVALSKG